MKNDVIEKKAGDKKRQQNKKKKEYIQMEKAEEKK